MLKNILFFILLTNSSYAWSTSIQLNWGEFEDSTHSVVDRPSIIKAEQGRVFFVNTIYDGLPHKVSITSFRGGEFSTVVNHLIKNNELFGKVLIDFKGPKDFFFTGFDYLYDGRIYSAHSVTERQGFFTYLTEFKPLSIAKNKNRILVRSKNKSVLIDRNDYKKISNFPFGKRGDDLGCGDFFYQHKITRGPLDSSFSSWATEITKYDSNLRKIASSIFPYALKIKCNLSGKVHIIKHFHSELDSKKKSSKLGIYSLESDQSSLKLRLIGQTTGDRFPAFESFATSFPFSREAPPYHRRTQPLNNKYLLHVPDSGLDKDTGRVYKIQFFKYSDSMRTPAFSCVFAESYTFASIVDLNTNSFAIHAVTADSKDAIIKVNVNYNKKCQIYSN